MSQLTYDNVMLPYCFCTDFRQEAVYEDSHTDWYCTKFDIRVQSLVNYHYLNMLCPDLLNGDNPGTTNAADIMNAIRSRLLRPRRTLTFTFNGVELIPAVANTGRVDVKNGPQPQSCVITQLSNTLFLFTYHIIAHYWERNTIDTAADPVVRNRMGNAVLYNRWEERVEIDGSNFSTRTRTGKFAIRSDNEQGYIADQVRSQMAVLSVPPGFLRESAEYTVTPDGLAVSYRVVDKEVYRMPPAPAFKAEGEYFETTTKAGNFRFGQCRIRLHGDADTPQAKLIETAVAVAVSKVRLGGVVGIVLQGVISLGVYENWAEFNLNVQFKTGTRGSAARRFKGIAGFRPYDEMTVTPFSDFNTSPKYLDRGTAKLLLQAAKYYDPSLTDNQLVASVTQAASPQTPTGSAKTQLNNGLAPGQAGKKREP